MDLRMILPCRVLFLALWLFGAAACGDEDSSSSDGLIILEDVTGCGDGTCGDDESASSCPGDCPARCGDGLCTQSESASSCAVDCPAVCGDMSCTHNEDAFSCIDDCSPSHVTVTFLQFLVAPTKSSGCQWDGLTCGELDEKQRDAIAKIRTGNLPIDAVLQLLALGVFDSLNAPDVVGQVDFRPTGEGWMFDGGEDNYQASIQGLTFENVPYNDPFIFGYSLFDEDISNHDAIASGTLSKQDMDRILRSDYEGWITDKVYAASNGQLLGIFVSVFPSR